MMTNKENDIDSTRKIILAWVYYVLIILVGWFLFKKSTISLDFVNLIYSLIFFGFLPYLLIVRGYGEKIIQYNWPSGYVKKQLIFSGMVVFGCSLLFWLFMLKWGGGEGARKMIWMNKGLINLMGKNLLILPIGLLAQEFFFRGFLLNSLQKKVSKFVAVLVVAILVALFNLATTMVFSGWVVLLGIVLFNMFLGWLAVKFRSVVFSFLFYWLGIIVINFWVLWQLGNKIN